MGSVLNPRSVPNGRACWVIFNLCGMHMHEVYWCSTLPNKACKSQNAGLTFGWTSTEIPIEKFSTFHGEFAMNWGMCWTVPVALNEIVSSGSQAAAWATCQSCYPDLVNLTKQITS